MEEEELPKAGLYNVILNSKDEAVCIIRNTKVYVTAYCDVTAEHAYKEGEGDKTLEYWREVHQAFFSKELAEIGKVFTSDMKVVCEELELLYVAE